MKKTDIIVDKSRCRQIRGGYSDMGCRDVDAEIPEYELKHWGKFKRRKPPVSTVLAYSQPTRKNAVLGTLKLMSINNSGHSRG